MFEPDNETPKLAKSFEQLYSSKRSQINYYLIVQKIFSVEIEIAVCFWNLLIKFEVFTMRNYLLATTHINIILIRTHFFISKCGESIIRRNFIIVISDSNFEFDFILSGH